MQSLSLQVENAFFPLTLRSFPFPLFGLSSLHFALISVFRRVKDIKREFQEYCPLQDGWHAHVELWWERYQDARAFRILRVRFPMITALIPFLATGPLLKRKSGNEHEQYSQEERTKYARVKCGERATMDIMVSCR